MFNECSRPGGPASNNAIAIEALWIVDADNSYDVRRTKLDRNCLVAVRTRAGSGRIYLDSGREINVSADTLLCVEWERIRRYHTADKVWSFWWFEFTVSGTPHFPLQRLLPVVEHPADAADCKAIFAELRRLSFPERALACARFGVMLYRWLAQWNGQVQRTPQFDMVQDCIEQMHARVSSAWTVAEMARRAHLCERQFRHIFRRQTGKSPKQFYDELRVKAAREMLALGVCNVSQAAERFGFSSPAHFCKAFQRHYKSVPSKLQLAE